MTDLPNKIVSIKVLKLNRNLEKICKCRNRHYIVDETNRLVYCEECGAVIDPYEALLDLAKHRERLREDTKHLLEQRREIVNYKPHLIVFRKLERGYRGKKMLPCCPHCKEPFYFEEINSWTNRQLVEMWREREQK